jgi:hypothetical protein
MQSWNRRISISSFTIFQYILASPKWLREIIAASLTVVNISLTQVLLSVAVLTTAKLLITGLEDGDAARILFFASVFHAQAAEEMRVWR